MKNALLSALLALVPCLSQAASLKISATESLHVVEAMLLAGVKADLSKPIYALRLDNVKCKARNVSHAGSPDDILWGMEQFECRNPAVEGAAAKLIYEALDSIQTKYGEKITITDCAMGSCYASLKTLRCDINSNETTTETRFSCSLTDEQ